MREESAKKKARERDEDKKMAKRLDATRENDNRIEQEKIREREREAEERKKALPEEMDPRYSYRTTGIWEKT